jgi:hypothetical protein
LFSAYARLAVQSAVLCGSARSKLSPDHRPSAPRWPAPIVHESLIRKISPFGAHLLPVHAGDLASALDALTELPATDLPVRILRRRENVRP